MPKMPISEAVIRQNSSSQSFQRGQNYYRDGAVLDIQRRGDQILGEVEGSEYDPYRVSVTFDQAGIINADCSCPYDWGGYCKHIVAVMLAAIYVPEEIEDRPTLASLLEDLSREQLGEVIAQIVNRDPRLVAFIENFVQMAEVSADVSTSTSPRQRQTPIDPAPIRRQVHNIIHSHDHYRSYEAYGQVGEIVQQLEEILSQAETFLHAGDGQNALVILEALSEEYIEEWFILDNHDGDASSFFEVLGGVWAEAVLIAEMSSEEREAWAKKFTAWQREIDDYSPDFGFDVAQAAVLQGWDYPPLVRVLRGKITRQGTWEGEAPWYADDLAIARLNVLERQGRIEEYLYLAEAEGQTELYLTMLAKSGRTDEAVNNGLEQMATVSEALALAKALREQDEMESALRIAEHGLTLQGYQKVRLARWLRDTATIQKPDLALCAAEIAFSESNSFSDYLSVQPLAGKDWPEYQTRMLKSLKKVSYVSDKIEIYLHEGMVEKAMRVVETESYIGYDWIEQVVDASCSSHPDWAIRQCQKQAERIMNAGQSKNYDNAVDWLMRAKAICLAANREDEWNDYLGTVLDKHFRKYSLVPKLKKLI